MTAPSSGAWTLVLWICGLLYALVLVFLGHSLWRARRVLALGGSVALTLIGLITLSVGSFFIDRHLSQVQLDNAVKIKVTAAQWWWKVEYQDPTSARWLITANELKLPAGRSALLELHAADVIHSLWIPHLGGKQDVIPGLVNTLVLTPRREGQYRGQCAALCGSQHAQMGLDATVMTESEFARWRDRQSVPAPTPKTPEQIRGHELFMSGPCARCHQIVGTPAAGRSGPDLTHLASRQSIAAGARPYSIAALHDWLRDPHSVKPGNHMPQEQLSATDLDALTAYLDSLK